MSEPREGVGYGLGFEVVSHGREVEPGGVAAKDFDDTGAEHQAGKEEPEGPLEQAGSGIGSGRSGKKSGFFQKDEKESGFEQESVPLEGEEVLTDVDEGQPAEPREGGRERAKKSQS